MDRSEATCPKGVAAVRRQPSNQAQCLPTPDLSPQCFHQAVVVDRVEERFQVATPATGGAGVDSPKGCPAGVRPPEEEAESIHDVAAAFRPTRLHLGHRVVRGVAGSVTMAVFAEVRFKVRTQHLCNGLLNHPIQHRRNPEGTPCPVGLGNPHPSNGCGMVGAISDGIGDPRPLRPRERGMRRSACRPDPPMVSGGGNH